MEIVKNFVELSGNARFVATKEFDIVDKGETIEMLGTYSPVPALEWAVVAQKPQREAYQSINEMQRTSAWLALAAVLVSILIGVLAARNITSPIEILTKSSRAIAKGDFSQRVVVHSRTEIGELASTFN